VAAARAEGGRPGRQNSGRHAGSSGPLLHADHAGNGISDQQPVQLSFAWDEAALAQDLHSWIDPCSYPLHLLLHYRLQLLNDNDL